jgi:hypothetical protein
LSGSPIQVRYLRILLYKSSGKGPPESTDLRDSLGFAIREIFLGASADGRAFRDDIFHAANNKLQTVVYRPTPEMRPCSGIQS